MVVIVTARADAFAALLMRRSPRLLAWTANGRPKRRDVARWLEPRPVRWLHTTTVSGAALIGKLNFRPEQRNMAVALGIVDASRLGGVTWGQLSAHVAMAAFTRAEPDAAEKRSESVLALFSRDAAAEQPRSLTRWDEAFLNALYSTAPTLSTARQRERMQDRMARTLSADPASTPTGSATDQRE